MNSKVAIYCRLSEEDKDKKRRDDDSGSIANQKLMLIEYATQHEWMIFDIYSDDDYAGSDRNRPEFNRLINDAKQKKFDIVLCKTQSRFTRELEIVEMYIHNLFPLLGIRFVSIVDNIDTDVAGNKKTRQINGLINEWYLEDMSDSIKAALRTRMKAGFFIGSFAPYGYKKDPENKGHLIPDENVAYVVQDIFHLYNSGVGRTQIARILNDKGIPSPSEYYRLNHIKRDGNAKGSSKYWKYYTVSHILENEVYIGNLVQGQTYNPTYKSKHSIAAAKDNWVRVENTHEPLIDKETWETTRRLWKMRSKQCYTANGINKFTGFLYCAKCGYKMGTAYNKHKRYYRCNNAKYGKNCCDGTSVFESTLEKAILQEIQSIKKQYIDKEYIQNNIELTQKIQEHKNQLNHQLDELGNQLSIIENALKNLYIDKLKGIISVVQFQDLANQFENEKAQVSKQIQTVSNRLRQLSDNESDKKHIQESVKKILSFDSISKEMLNEFVDRIEVGGTKQQRHIDIYWKL